MHSRKVGNMPDLTINVTPSSREATHLRPGQTVEFHTPHDCRLYFSNAAVFNREYVDLTSGKPTPLTVAANGATTWAALMPVSAPRAGASAGGPGSKRTMGDPNEIVVP
jgi:hypothetical protein